jgi:FlaG/FlaF family flagellin (archaellin)
MKIKIILLGLILLGISCTENEKLPTVVTLPVTEVTWEYALTGGEVIDEGGSPVTKRGVCATENESTPPNIDDYGTWYSIDSSGIGSFLSKIAVRWHGAAYTIRDTHYVRAYATNSAGTAYGEVLSFYPGDKPLSDNSITIKSITTTATSAILNYEFYYQIYSTVREFGICYSNSPNASIEEDYIVISDIDEGQNSITIESLTPNTEYYIRSYDKNQAGIYYSSEKKFTTID